MIWGQTRQVYRVPYEEASVAFLQWCTGEPDVDPVAGERYLAMFGDRYPWMDLGLGLSTTALAGMLLAAVLYISRPDEPWLRTPLRRWHFMMAGWAVIAWNYFGVVYSLEKDLERRQFPWCADSIGIPIYGLSFTTTVLLIICTAVGLLLTLGFGALPAPLGQWNHGRPLYSWLVTGMFGALIAVVGIAMILNASISMSIANPAGLLAIYLLASARAALLAPKLGGE
jgi:hypothetical protein